MLGAGTGRPSRHLRPTSARLAELRSLPHGLLRAMGRTILLQMAHNSIDPRPSAGGEVSLWELLAVLLRRRWTILLTTLIAVAGAVAFALLRAATYTTQASFRPQGSESSTS